MNRDQKQGQWSRQSAPLTSASGRRTDVDFSTVARMRLLLLGKLQTRYGVLKHDAEKQIDDWTATLSSSAGPNNTEGGKETS